MSNEIVFENKDVIVACQYPGQEKPTRFSCIHMNTVEAWFEPTGGREIQHLVCDTQEEGDELYLKWLGFHLGDTSSISMDKLGESGIGRILSDCCSLATSVLIEANEVPEDEWERYNYELVKFIRVVLNTPYKHNSDDRTICRVLLDKNIEDYCLNGSVKVSSLMMDYPSHQRAIQFILHWFDNYWMSEIKGTPKYSLSHYPSNFRKPIEWNEILTIASFYIIDTSKMAPGNKAVQEAEINGWLGDLWKVNQGRVLKYQEVVARSQKVIEDEADARKRRQEMRERRRAEKVDEPIVIVPAPVTMAPVDAEPWVEWSLKEKLKFVKKLFGF